MRKYLTQVVEFFIIISDLNLSIMKQQSNLVTLLFHFKYK